MYIHVVQKLSDIWQQNMANESGALSKDEWNWNNHKHRYRSPSTDTHKISVLSVLNGLKPHKISSAKFYNLYPRICCSGVCNLYFFAPDATGELTALPDFLTGFQGAGRATLQMGIRRKRTGKGEGKEEGPSQCLGWIDTNVHNLSSHRCNHHGD